MVFEVLAESFAVLIATTGYFGIFILMTWESMIIPIPSELVMPFAGWAAAKGNLDFVLVVGFATLGSLAGSFVSYYTGKYFGRDFIVSHGEIFGLKRKHLRMVEDWFAKRGHATVFIGRFVPVVRHLISIPAGMSNMPPGKFAAMTIAGAGMWNLFLASFGYALQENYFIVAQHQALVDVLVVLLIIVALVYAVVRYWRH
ncbi:MAG: DedA family protein [Candidatus Diapherotrites archaeon]|nr:DedA family protein [Candidatus Diapherotrites archaeon]MDZ4256431.1 DedA family protein [archaeon]